MAETSRRREKQEAYNAAHGITPATIKRGIQDIMGSVAARDSLTIDPRDPMAWKRGAGLKEKRGAKEETTPFLGHNIKAYIADLERQMREAASNLEFEQAGKLRDEIRKLRETELFIADDPLARQEDVRAGVKEAVSGPSVNARPRGGGMRGRRRK